MTRPLIWLVYLGFVRTRKTRRYHRWAEVVYSSEIGASELGREHTFTGKNIAQAIPGAIWEFDYQIETENVKEGDEPATINFLNSAKYIGRWPDVNDLIRWMA
jgi:hypothetical protein